MSWPGQQGAGRIEGIDPRELSDRLQGASLVLLDVREPEEVAHCRIEGSLHIPLGRLREEAASRLEPEHEIVVYCHHGTRSLMAAQLLQSLGFSRVINLDGGIDRWSLEVDPQLPRY